MPISLIPSTDAPTYLRGLIFGPSGVGKTFSSLTLSDLCPADLTHVRPKTRPMRTPVSLEDLIWVGFDNGATLGFAEQGLSVPLLDLSTSDPKVFFKDTEEAWQILAKEAPHKKAIVFDTISEMDSKLLEHLQVTQAGLEGYDLFRVLKSLHSRLLTPLLRLPCHLLFLCHSKAEIEAAGQSPTAQAQQQQQRRKLLATGQALVGPAITGSSRDLYRRNVSLTFFVQKGFEGGAAAAFFLNQTSPDIEGKSRLIFPDKMPADWRKVLAPAKA